MSNITAGNMQVTIGGDVSLRTIFTLTGYLHDQRLEDGTLMEGAFPMNEPDHVFFEYSDVKREWDRLVSLDSRNIVYLNTYYFIGSMDRNQLPLPMYRGKSLDEVLKDIPPTTDDASEERSDSAITRLSRITEVPRNELVTAFDFARTTQMNTPNVREIVVILESHPCYKHSQETFWDEAVEEWLSESGVDHDLMY